jgi:hypothetical protein
MEEAMTENSNYMQCSQFEELVHELDRPGTKGGELRERALIHAESCGHCAALLTENESLDFALTKIASEAERNVVPPRLEAALLQEFRRSKRISARRRMRWQVAAIGVAAALFLALGLSLQHRSALQLGHAVGAQAGLNASEPRAYDSTADAHEDNQGSTQGKPRTPRENATADHDSDDTEVAQDFTPLPYADDPSMMEGGSVVRVILSRSALASFGVSLTGVENAEQIPADLVVSADGTPEAIRLVAQNVN